MRLDPITLTVSCRRVQGCYAKTDAFKKAQTKTCATILLHYKLIELYEFDELPPRAVRHQVMPDDHSELVPLLPIPNRTVKRLSADDSADSRVKVGHRQALIARGKPRLIDIDRGLSFA